MTPGDQVMEAHDRIRDPVAGPAGGQQVVVAYQEPGGGHHLEMVDDIAGRPAHGGGDVTLGGAPSAIACRRE